MDEIFFGKARIILLPVLLGLVAIFFLKIFSIKISFWIALFVVVLIIAIIWMVFSRTATQTSSTTSTTKTEITSLWQKSKPLVDFLVVIAIFAAVIIGLLSVFNVQYTVDRTENFDNNEAESFRGYDIKGNYEMKNNALYIVGTAIITRKTSEKQPWITFDASGGGLVWVDILDNGLPDYGYNDFKSSRIVIIKNKRNYYFKIKGDFYYFYINNNFAESFGIAEGGRERRERTYRVKVQSITPEGVWIDNIESK